MTFASASATSPTEKVKSAAGEHDKPLLLLTLHTEGVSPALTLSELELSTQGTSTGALERLILYRGEQALTVNRIGEATVTGDQVRLQLSAPLELNYGDNTFLLTGDISASPHAPQPSQARRSSSTSPPLPHISSTTSAAAARVKPRSSPYIRTGPSLRR